MIVVKLVMKHRSLYFMPFVMRTCTCVIFLYFGTVLLCACKSDVGRSDGGTDMNTGVVENTYDSQSVIGTDAATSIEGMPVTRKGYNPQMDFVYDEHDDVDVDEDYVNTLCGEAGRQLEEMFGPAEFYVAAVHNEDESYTINVMYNEKAVSFSDEELQQINMCINQEYKEVRLSEINIQGW